MAPARFAAFAITFALVYPIAYFICVENNFALFTYHPAINEWNVGVQKGRDGPAMYWYGWLATSGIVALAAALLATLLPDAWTRRASSATWIVALGVMLAFCYLLRGFFVR
ncbi:MAG TPA: hypothetical protein VM183_00305 [Burkholderiales bacterium]|nr:hypothetical protein [Burkholderiales bacterium]